MKTSLNRINNNYVGSSELYYSSGIYSVNKDYNRMVGTEWIQPSEWLLLPDLSGVTQAIVGLVALIPGFSSGHTGITSNSNFLGFRARPAYIVDWGDGTTQAYADLAIASKQYNYYSFPDTNLTSEGYKQVIIQITPQSGNNLTYFDFNQKAVISGTTLPNGTPNNFLKLKIKGPNLNNSTAVGALSKYPLLKSIEFIGPTQLTTTGFVSGLNNLEHIGGELWTQNITSAFSFMFVSDSSLKAIPFLDIRNANSAVQTTNGCVALRHFPPIHSSKITTFNSTFYNNYSLEYVPYLDTLSCDNFLQMHTSNSALRRVPNYNTINGITMNSMFNGCYSLLELPNFNTSKVKDFSGAFSALNCIKTIPSFDTSNGINMSSWLRFSLRVNVIPEFNYNSATSAVYAYANSLAAWKIGTISGGTGLKEYGQVFAATRPIIAGVSAAGGTLSGITFYNTTEGSFYPQSIRVGPIYNAGGTLSYVNCSMSPTALNEVFTSLATLSGVCASINITGNWGSSGCDRTIATSKGWQVIG